ncbi:MAG: ATP-binding protein, partial [Verrucomicrobiota bacterium]
LDAVKSENSGEQTFRAVRPDGSIRNVHSIFTIERDGAGEPVRMTGINFDITDKLAAEQAARLKARFLASVSHEIRTPLSARVNLSQSMVLESEKHSLPAEFAEHLESVRAGGQYLNLILTNLLDISAMESGHAPVRPETFYLRDWVDDVSAIIKPIARSRSVDIVWSVPGDDNLHFTTDSVRLTQIFLNLSHNAVKFSLKPGSKVRISVVQNGESLQLSVADEGPGIDPSRLDALFQEFSQSETAGPSVDRGAGLGLAVVRQNTRLLGGTLRTRPVQPTGICFEIHLPNLGDPLQKPCAR